MPTKDCVFSLPLEIESDNFNNSEDDALLHESSTQHESIYSVPQSDRQNDKNSAKFQGQLERNDAVKKKSVCSSVIFTLNMIKWHVLVFLILTSSFYAVFHFCCNKKDQTEILKALALFDDWRQLVFFFGIYFSYTVKKVGDVSAFIPPTDKIANLVSFAVKVPRVQKAIMKYICTSLAMVFTYLSPMVCKRLTSSENNIKAKLEIQNQKIIDKIEQKLLNIQSSHFIPLKWALHVVDEAHARGEIDSRYVNTLVAEINALHTQCDRLVRSRHEHFSWGLTCGVTTSLFSYFVVGSIRCLYNALEDKHSYILPANLAVHLIIFLGFLILLRNAQQIVLPYNEDHDVFELNRILNEKIEVASFVLDNRCDLRREMRDTKLFP